MANLSYVQILLNFNYPDMSDERLEGLVQSFQQEFRERDQVEKVSRVIDLNPPIGNMSGGRILPGWLKVEVTVPNIVTFLRFLGDRLFNTNKIIELEVEYKNKEITKIKAKGSSREDIKALLEQAKSVIEPEIEIIRVAIEPAEAVRAAIEPAREIDYDG